MNKFKTQLWLSDTITWLVLCSLTLLSYQQFDKQGEVTGSNAIILLAVLKFILVYLFFMKMKKADKYWHVLTLTYLLIIVGFAS